MAPSVMRCVGCRPHVVAIIIVEPKVAGLEGVTMSDEPGGEALRSRLARAKPMAAVHRRYAGSIGQDIGRTLSDLDVANQATLLGAGLLAALLPY
jgi:hypothetical protein